MSDKECVGDGVCGDGAPDLMPPRASRAGRRSGVVLHGERDSDTALLEAAKAAPRRSSIIKVQARRERWRWVGRMGGLGGSLWRSKY
uniref:Uncharacterized protein n=1 Tax=Astyanax mexicanus TaxID=7994 RepID=A0A8B9J478_ASTMX